MTAEEGDRRTWELAGQLVQIDSSDPGAYEGQIEQWIYEWFTKEIEEKAGALKNRIELIQKEVMPGRFNLMARIPGKDQRISGTSLSARRNETADRRPRPENKRTNQKP